jgi:hypothetical protein
VFLALWATPRSTSTAFEWMMRQRGDFTCVHEPWNELYYYGEDRRSDRDGGVPARPGHTYAAVWEGLVASAGTGDLFVKDFAYSVEHDLDDAKLAVMTHTFLVREPRRVVQGLASHWPDCTFEEVGFASLHRLFERIADRDGTPPPVMASDDLLDDPAGTIRAYCAAVGIPFLPEALTWEEGERPEVNWYGEGTGPWHDSLRHSTGISRPTTEYPPLEDDPRLLDLYGRSLPHYESLMVHRTAPLVESGS